MRAGLRCCRAPTRRTRIRLYFAITRDYDTPSSRIVLASSEDGIQLHGAQESGAAGAANSATRIRTCSAIRSRKRYFLTFYRGNDEDYFDIVSKSAD